MHTIKGYVSAPRLSMTISLLLWAYLWAGLC